MKIIGSIFSIGHLVEGGNSVFVFTVQKNEGEIISEPLNYNALFIARTSPFKTSDMMLLLALIKDVQNLSFRCELSIEADCEPPTGRNVDDWKLRVNVLAIEPLR